MSTLPTLGVTSYNGYTFGVESQTIGISITPVYDSAGRTAIGNKYLVKLKAYILNSGGTDATMADIRNRLTRPGQTFTYTGKGIGPISVGPNNKEVKFGPLPRELSWEPIGGNLAGEITWQVEFMTLDCTGALFSGSIMEFCFKLEYSQDERRLTTRHYSGHIKIPNNRSAPGSRQLLDSADNYYQKVCPEVPTQFRRTNEHRALSEDKSTLEFSFQDVQLLVPPPAGCLAWSFHHSQSMKFPNPTFMGTMRASYEVVLNWPIEVTYWHFMLNIRDRLQAINKAPQLNGNQFVRPLSFTMEENVETRTGSYSMTYMLATNILATLTTAGFWRPMVQRPGDAVVAGGGAAQGAVINVDNGAPGVPCNFETWAQSMVVGVRPRGFTQEIVGPQYDVIVDLCSNLATAPLAPRPPVAMANNGNLDGFPCSPCPPEDNSWIWYQLGTRVTIDQGTATNRPLPPKAGKPPRPSLTDVFGDAGTDASQQAPPTTQQRVAPRVFVHLTGFAIRACYPIPSPAIDNVNGNPVLPANREDIEYFVTTEIPVLCGTVWVAKWELRYELTQSVNPDDVTNIGAKTARPPRPNSAPPPLTIITPSPFAR